MNLETGQTGYTRESLDSGVQAFLCKVILDHCMIWEWEKSGMKDDIKQSQQYPLGYESNQLYSFKTQYLRHLDMRNE
jgi:hypothetical protein